MQIIRTKLGSLTAVIIILLSVSLLSYWSINVLVRNQDSYNEHTNALLALERTLSTISGSESQQRESIIAHEHIDTGRVRSQQNEALALLNEYRANLESHNIPAGDSILALTNQRYDILVKAALYHNKSDSAHFSEAFAAGVKTMKTLRTMIKEQEQQIRSSSDSLHASSDRLSYVTHITILVSLAVTLLLAVVTYRRISKAIRIKERAERMLRESEHMRNKITDIVPGLITVYNIRTGQYLYVNDAIFNLLGYEKNTALDKGLEFFMSIIHPDDAAAIMQENKEALHRANTDPEWNDLATVNFEYRLRHRNGDYRWFFTSGLVFKRGEDGLVEELINLSFDITENKQYEADLELSEAKFRTLFEKSRDAVFLLSSDRIIDCNSAALDLFNTGSKASIIGKTPAELSPAKQADGILSPVKLDTLITQTIVNGWNRFEWLLHKFTGEDFWVEVSITPLTIDGEVLMHAVVRDITERKKNEEQLSKSEELLLEAHKMANLGSWEWDIPSNIVTWTDELYRMYGYEPGSISVSYETFLAHLHEEDTPHVRSAIESSYSTLQPFSFEHRIVQPGGAVRTLLAKGRVITDAAGKPVKMRGSTLDITDIKNTREELRQKEEFIGIASHELKTPLTSVKAYVQLLEQMIKEKNDAMMSAYISKTSTHVDRLNRLISDLLDVSKIQAGKLQFNISEFCISELVKESIESIQYTSATHRIIMQGEENVHIKGDKIRLEQAFVNFLTNAIKYSPKADKVIVNLASMPGEVKISVTDFGIGIPSEKVSKIFDRFYRVENTPHKFTGLGIGLYIASEIIQRHNGKIWVETTEGKGSTFHFTLPLN